MANEFMTLMDEAITAIIEKRAEEMVGKRIEQAVSASLYKQIQIYEAIEDLVGVMSFDTLHSISIHTYSEEDAADQKMAETILMAIDRLLNWELNGSARPNEKRIESLKMARLNLTAKMLSGKGE